MMLSTAKLWRRSESRRSGHRNPSQSTSESRSVVTSATRPSGRRRGRRRAGDPAYLARPSGAVSSDRVRKVRQRDSICEAHGDRRHYARLWTREKAANRAKRDALACRYPANSHGAGLPGKRLLGRASRLVTGIKQPGLGIRLRARTWPTGRIDSCRVAKGGSSASPSRACSPFHSHSSAPIGGQTRVTPADPAMARPGLEPGTPRFSVVCSTN